MTRHGFRLGALLLLMILSGSMFAADDYQESSRLYKEGKRAEAFDRVNAYLAQHPRDSRARFLKGVILAEQNKNAQAIAVFTELTEEYPELPEPYNNLAVLYANQGDYEKARKSLEMAIRTHPSYAVAHENLGDLYATLASQAYDKALQLDSNNATARKKLALIKELVPARPAPIAPKSETDKAPPPKAAAEGISATASRAQPETSKAAPGKSGTNDAKSTANDKPARAPDAVTAILQMLEHWTQAWSSNDADSYLSFYSPDFRPPNGESREAWEESRRDRLAKPKKISVTATSPRVKMTDNNHATVTFRQNYSSDSLRKSGTKTLHVVRNAERWLIQRESIDK